MLEGAEERACVYCMCPTQRRAGDGGGHESHRIEDVLWVWSHRGPCGLSCFCLLSRSKLQPQSEERARPYRWDQGPLRNGSHGYRNAHLRRGCAERECGRSVPRSAAVTHRCCGICRRLRAVALSRPWRTAVGHHTAAPVRTEERARSALALPRFRAAAPSRSWRKRAVHQLPGSFFCGLHLTFYGDLYNKNYIHIFTHTAKTIYIASHSERGRGRPCQRWHD